MADGESDYKVGPVRPPLHIRFRKRQSGNPGGRRGESLPALLADALNEAVVVAIAGRRREITKREAIVAQWSTNRRVPDLGLVIAASLRLRFRGPVAFGSHLLLPPATMYRSRSLYQP
jgi:hypothetical protein